tara:strand:- start:6033 stop:6647 length:615 start_codon:yes stop_codon:yes gene_type:complete
MSNKNQNLFTKIDNFTNNLSEKFSESIISERYEELVVALDQKQKNKITLCLSYLFSITPFAILVILLFVNSHIRNNNELLQSLEGQIGQIEKLQVELKKISSKLIGHKSFSSKSKAKSFFKNSLREYNLPDTSINVTKLEEGFVGDLKKIYIELSFSKLGSQELNKLIKIIKNNVKASITKINIRSDKTSRLALGFIHLEFVAK